jgi:hypothetical protein
VGVDFNFSVQDLYIGYRGKTNTNAGSAPSCGANASPKTSLWSPKCSPGRLTLLCSSTVPRQDRAKYQDEMSQSRSLGVDKTFVIDNSSTLTSAWMELFVLIFEVTECNGIETFLGRSSWCLHVRVKRSLDINGEGGLTGRHRSKWF